jgi:hypothetical protein
MISKVKDELMFSTPIQVLLTAYLGMCTTANPSMILTGSFEKAELVNYLMLSIVVILPIGIMIFIHTREQAQFENKAFDTMWKNLY